MRYAGFYGSNEKEEPKPIRKLGYYQTIELWSYDSIAQIRLIELMRNAGIELSNQECERANIPAGTRPELRWVLWILYALRNHRRGFVTQGEYHPEHYASQRWESVRNVCVASMVAIDEQLHDSPQKAPGNTKRKTQTAVVTAVTLVKDHPDWSDRRIAEQAGISASTLSRSKLYQNAALLARQERIGPGRGYVDKNSGKIEAIDDD